MRIRKRIRDKGKIAFSTYFKELKHGDSVALVREMSMPPQFPKRMQGRTGTVIASRGEAYIVEVNDLNKKKQIIAHPVHLKKIEVKK